MRPHVKDRRPSLLEEVFRTNDPVTLSYVKHLLWEAGIEPFVLDEHTAFMDGRGPLIPIRVVVRSDLVGSARNALKDVEQDA
ncbi:MAG: DUF2007 domain-containing protein [Pseudomonadota bacterium]